MKKILLAALLIASPMTVSAASFTDIGQLAPKTQAEINEAVTLGLFKDATAFNPQRAMSRGQVTLTVARAIAGDQTPQQFVERFGLERQVTPFMDVPVAFKSGNAGERELYFASLIVKDAGAFTQPKLQQGQPIKRGQLAKVLVNAFDLKQGTAKVVITDVVGAEERVNTQILASLGITQPQGTNFKPTGQVTRAQMASFLVRTFSVLNK